MSFPTQNDVGYSLQFTGVPGDTATLGSLSNFFLRTDETFSIVFDVKFLDNNSNIFFGGISAGSNFLLSRNTTSISLGLQNEDGDLNITNRYFVWSAPLQKAQWYNIVINGTANADDGIGLFVDGVVKTITDQSNVGYVATAESLDLKFGDIDGATNGKFLVAKPYFYTRSLTVQEINDIKQRRIYPSDFSYAWNFKRPNIGS